MPDDAGPGRCLVQRAPSLVGRQVRCRASVLERMPFGATLRRLGLPGLGACPGSARAGSDLSPPCWSSRTLRGLQRLRTGVRNERQSCLRTVSWNRGMNGLCPVPGCRAGAITPDGPDLFHVDARGIWPAAAAWTAGARAVPGRCRRHLADLPPLGRACGVRSRQGRDGAAEPMAGSDRWLATAGGCGAGAVQMFAAALEGGGAAVRAALTGPWRSGQAKGQPPQAAEAAKLQPGGLRPAATACSDGGMIHALCGAMRGATCGRTTPNPGDSTGAASNA